MCSSRSSSVLPASSTCSKEALNLNLIRDNATFRNIIRRSLLVVGVVLTGTPWLAGCADKMPNNHQRGTESETSSIDDFVRAPDHKWLRPSVFIEGERFAQSFTLSDSAEVLFAAMPTAASVSIYLRQESNWIETQRVKLPNQMVSGTRRLSLVSDSSGDTLAAYSIDPVSHTEKILHILERLGESWITTASLQVPKTVDDGKWPQVTESLGQLQISHDGEELLLNQINTLILYYRSSTGWTQGEVLVLPPDRQILSVIADRNLHYHNVLERDHVGFWLSTWAYTDDHWHQLSRHSLPLPLDESDIVLALNTTGDMFTVGSWDVSSPLNRAPTAWRFSIASAGQIEVHDSVAGEASWSSKARLRMAVGSKTDAIAIGWQDKTASDASLSNYRYDAIEGSWYASWRLPDVIPVLAKQAFVEKIRFSADGRFLLLANPHSNAANTQNLVGEILIIEPGIH